MARTLSRLVNIHSIVKERSLSGTIGIAEPRSCDASFYVNNDDAGCAGLARVNPGSGITTPWRR